MKPTRPPAEPHTLTNERRTAEPQEHANTVTLLSGDFYVTGQQGIVIVTILGSCVAACMYDPIAHVGGMNHFLLPEGPAQSAYGISDSARYGVYAMEQLINGILAIGGLKSRLEVKVFGGANVIDNSAMIGTRNIEFVRNFLRQEGIPITNEDLGGDYPRRVRFHPDTGKALLLKLRRKEDMAVVGKEQRLMQTLKTKPLEGSIELF